ncbi:hypothetical protein DN068_09790 [Taibaiella soli]|uniref:Uncharacterized protein n=1 Tax=Taibaiella soli TaxID=1649169 RepID=A0A2W2BZ78_9BACT|nr:hypothetical protein DN068_09790 [Taibaiella soli]
MQEGADCCETKEKKEGLLFDVHKGNACSKYLKPESVLIIQHTTTKREPFGSLSFITIWMVKN